MELSLLAQFDDLRRCSDVLTDGTTEIEFRRFLQVQEESRMQWQATTAEAQRLQRELDKCSQERADLETKLFHARRLLEMETKTRRATEMERDALDKKLIQVCDFLKSDREVYDRMQDKFDFNMPARKRKSNSNKFVSEKFGNDINSTGSFLSDLSVTQSEEDFLDMSKFKKHRPSTTGLNGSITDTKSRRRSIRKSIANDQRCRKSLGVIDLDASDKIIATTKVTIPQDDGPIEATSTIQAVPNSALFDNKCDKVETVEPRYKTLDVKKTKVDAPTTPFRRSMRLQEDFTPSAPPLHEVNATPKLLLNLQGRHHEFSNRTILRTESCASCSKRFRFGASALKCRMCNVFVHPDCKINLRMACIPKSQGTPCAKNGKLGLISEYAPSIEPLVPGLIVHCVNEVETRGLTEEGIYRISGSEKDVKALKDRFLRGKTVPPLGNLDIHVICGCIKDFLRSLREPLIPTKLWASFANAVQNFNVEQGAKDIFSAINQLPQANRDTLAFLILHLQRVAVCKEVKMPIDNLAKIFGPTILGYSNGEIDKERIYHETIIQKDVMVDLLNLPTAYWSRFINVDTTDTDSPKASSTMFFDTPNLRSGNTTIRRERKFWETPPYPTLKR